MDNIRRNDYQSGQIQVCINFGSFWHSTDKKLTIALLAGRRLIEPSVVMNLHIEIRNRVSIHVCIRLWLSHICNDKLPQYAPTVQNTKGLQHDQRDSKYEWNYMVLRLRQLLLLQPLKIPTALIDRNSNLKTHFNKHIYANIIQDECPAKSEISGRDNVLLSPDLQNVRNM